MRNLFFVTIAFLFFVSCTGVNGSGNIITEKRNVDDFKGVAAGGAFEVELTNGPYAVEVEADDNIMKFISTEVENGVLEIRTKSGYHFNNAHTKIYVAAPEIKLLKSSGAATIKARDLLKSDGKITLESSGSASIEAEVDAPEVKAESSGASNIKIKGRTREYNASTSGSADIKSSDLLSERTEADASGASSIHLHASVNLSAEASGAANIYYRGAANVQQKTSGAAVVKKEEE
ncbi:MAG: head GIN domain-containing protein [Ferruginibacter sp.]